MHKHEHGGKSSEHFFDKEKLLKALNLPKNANLLEIGCGNGYLSLAIAKKEELNNQIYAIDLNQTAITELKENIQKEHLNNLTAIHLDFSKSNGFKTDQFDLCFMVNVAHGFIANQETEVVFSKIYRILKPGGSLKIVDFKKIPEIPGPPLEIKLSPEELINHLTPYHLIHKKTETISKYHYLVTFEKN